MHILGPIWDRGNVCACYTVFFTEVDYLRFASIRVLGAARPITIFVYLWYFRKCPAKVCFDLVDIYVTKFCGKVWNFAFRDGAVEESHFTQFALYYTCMWCFTDNSTNELADTSTRGPAIWFVSSCLVSELTVSELVCQRDVCYPMWYLAGNSCQNAAFSYNSQPSTPTDCGIIDIVFNFFYI